jgi:hypothetical protein
MTERAMNAFDYKGYKLVSGLSPNNLIGLVRVFDTRFPKQTAVYQTTSLDLAMRWVDAYRDGQHWAVEARVS